jgi:hypothetical protein
VSQPQYEPEPSTPEDVEAWRVLQEVLEERDRDWWAGDPDDEA